MSVSQFNFPTTIRFGAGVVSELPAYLHQHQLKRPLISTDPTIAGLDFFKQVVSDLTAKGVWLLCFMTFIKIR